MIGPTDAAGGGPIESADSRALANDPEVARGGLQAIHR
jgi:hypothetical protein